MSKIKCPNCNIDIDSNLTSCPFCGGIINSKATSSVDSKWMDSWTRKLLLVRIFSAVIFILLDVLSIVIIRTDDSTTTKYISGGIFALSVIPLLMCLLSIFKHRVYKENYDGYNVLMYQGFFSYLVVEDKVMAKKFMGILPIRRENILDPSTVCLFLNLNSPEIDEVSARSLKESKDILARLPNNKKVLAHFDGKIYELMDQLGNN